MKYIYTIILILFGLLHYSCENKPQNNRVVNKQVRIIDENRLFFDNVFDKTFTIEELDQWTSEDCSKISKITFGHFDTIPKAFDKFQNVEKINVGYVGQDIYIPDIFPKLKVIELEIAVLSIDKNARFKKTLEEIHGGKSTIKSISSFTELPNLKVVNIGYSDFSPFPTDLYKLENLEIFILGAYTGQLDITNLHLSNLKKIKKLGFHYGKILGFPKDIELIDSSVEVVIEHEQLSKKQRQSLKRFKKSKRIDDK